MRISILLSILFVSEGFASTSIIRQKRDLITVRNFICNLFGINYNPPTTRIILQRPSIENIYRVIDDDFYVRSVQDVSLSGMRTRNNQRTAPVYQVYGNRDDNDYSKTLKSPNDKIPLLNERLSKDRDVKLNNVVNEKNILPQRPLYIQNRLSELNNVPDVYQPVTTEKIRQPVIQSSYNAILQHPGAGEVHVSKYPLVRTSYKGYSIIGEKLNSSKNLSPSLTPLNDLVGLKTKTPVIQTATSEVTERTKLKINSSANLQKTVKFSEPIPIKYSYKNVFHTQPDKNTAIKFDNIISTANTDAASTTQRVPFKTSNSDFFLLPPIEKNDPLLTANKVNSYQENNQDKGFVKNKPMAAIDEPYTNKKEEKSKAKNYFEQRGDIPASFFE